MTWSTYVSFPHTVIPRLSVFTQFTVSANGTAASSADDVFSSAAPAAAATASAASAAVSAAASSAAPAASAAALDAGKAAAGKAKGKGGKRGFEVRRNALKARAVF